LTPPLIKVSWAASPRRTDRGRWSQLNNPKWKFRTISEILRTTPAQTVEKPFNIVNRWFLLGVL
jgi:hypothetical protein